MFVCFRPPAAVVGHSADLGGSGDARRTTFLERMCAEAEAPSVGRSGTNGIP